MSCRLLIDSVDDAKQFPYYGYLQRVRKIGDWESWIRFFLEGVMRQQIKR
ncbi:Fic family protein [Coxiella burnetii CbuG_Q212]|nr:Fic family protein [Coxiella burnetii CbuG_Q212]